MEEGIAIAQRSTFGWIEVEFTEVFEQGIPDDKTNNPIAEWLITYKLSYRVVELLLQGKFVRCKLLTQILFDDNLFHLAHDMAAAVEVVESD